MSGELRRGRERALRAVVFGLTLSLGVGPANAGFLSSIFRGAERSSERAVCRSVERSVLDRSLERDAGKGVERGAAQSVLTRDAERDAASTVERLPTDRTVFRYTTREQAEKEVRNGVEAGRHTTANASPGRPLTAENAQRHLGLPQQPDTRLTIRLPKGTNVKANKIVGGAPGAGELRLAEPVPASAITSEVPLKHSGN